MKHTPVGTCSRYDNILSALSGLLHVDMPLRYC